MRIVYLNVENLFLSSEDAPMKHPLEKDPNKAKEIAKFLLDFNPDIVWLIEVGGEESLNNFNTKYLSDHFIPSLIPGNSDRGIELGLLIKKNLPYRCEHLTHKNRPLHFNYPHEIAANQMAAKIGNPPPFESQKLSRDFGEVRIYDQGSDIPKLIVLCAHLKSQLDPKGIDPRGSARREAEAKLLAQVVEAITLYYGGQVPVIFGGDMNGQINDPEFLALKRLPHQELCDILKLPHHDRVTHVYFDKWDKRIEQQMDFCFVPPLLTNRIDSVNSGIYRWRGKEENLLPLPQNQFQRYTLPSDHYPVVLSLEID